MNRKIIISFVVMILMIFVLNTTNTYASLLGETLLGGKNFVESSSGNVAINSTGSQSTFKGIYNTLLMISFVVVAVVGISLGIKFMMSGVDEKADVKKSLTIFVIGCIVIYGSFGIWSVIVNFLNTL